MEDYKSKYTGEQVEELLDQVANGGTSGGSSLANVKAEEADFNDDSLFGEDRPIRDAVDLTTGEKVYFVGHTYSIFTYNGAFLQDELDDIKAQAIILHEEVGATEASGSLSFEFVQAMNMGTVILNGGIARYGNDMSIITSISSVENIVTITKIYLIDLETYERITIDEYDMDNLGSGGITTETDPIFSASPAATITEKKIAEWNGKQDAISDLATIREGAALGATALQEHQDISHLATKQEVSDIVGDINTILESIING